MLEKIIKKVSLKILSIKYLIRKAVIRRETEAEEYIVYLYRYLLNREPEESEIELQLSAKQSHLNLFKGFISSQEYQDKQTETKINLSLFLGLTNCLLGENTALTASNILNWYKTAAELTIELYNQNKYSALYLNNKPLDLIIKDKDFTLTIITSLYKGEKYIQSFLENIISQSIFSECQLFIVDANSSENEQKIIDKYTKIYPNIGYLKMEERIGIYDAWNLAIKNSTSEFITNANVDDLHRRDAFELKVKALRENQEIDVVYSDVYYSFLENLPFEIVEKCGLKTNLPMANKSNLLQFNSPHNSPMWRRALHDKIGYFDTAYKSAGDYEFWLRAAFSGSYFMKIQQPVVSYYSNPQGMSTSLESPSLVEEEKILKIYQNIYNSQDESN